MMEFNINFSIFVPLPILADFTIVFANNQLLLFVLHIKDRDTFVGEGKTVLVAIRGAKPTSLLKEIHCKIIL